ncbi:DUF4238 domain-containing protein [Pseudomonas syringae pv. actinidiae]|nr:DUF4238 domain-containing protein [Pseudomonas syringae pv. actinidiae]MDU8625966.1 DUF4238 domain-containing protein [Pseudomonas syringae pv. actinidiae]MDU8642079.1 DUF4238 domain-containing protein [Pseudomonas syringae pv. actinidiae]
MIAKVQHYVPQFLMRNFGNGIKDQVWVYDKSSDRSFASNVKNVASEGRFYDFEHKGLAQSIEPWLSELEGHARSAISVILEADSPLALEYEQKQTLASFLAVQLTRTKTFREEWDSLPKMLRAHFEHTRDKAAPGSHAEAFLRDIPKNDLKEQTTIHVLKAPSIYADQFLTKDWVLVATSTEYPFLLGDNPLTRQNSNDQGHRGNLGLTSPGVEISLPLSSTRALAMLCPTLTNAVHRCARSVSNELKGDVNDPGGFVAMSNTLSSGRPLQYSAANVENLNSLQIVWSERYIFSSSNDFDLARAMIKDHPHLKYGPRTTVA